MSCDEAEELCYSCPTCVRYEKQTATEPMLSHPTPTRPWQFISQDIFEIGHKSSLINVDHYSDVDELDQLSNTQSPTVIIFTKAHFTRPGIPARCLADNGPQFISHKYKQFATQYRLEHITTSPY